MAKKPYSRCWTWGLSVQWRVSAKVSRYSQHSTMASHWNRAHWPYLFHLLCVYDFYFLQTECWMHRQNKLERFRFYLLAILHYFFSAYWGIISAIFLGDYRVMPWFSEKSGAKIRWLSLRALWGVFSDGTISLTLVNIWKFESFLSAWLGKSFQKF